MLGSNLKLSYENTKNGCCAIDANRAVFCTLFHGSKIILFR